MSDQLSALRLFIRVAHSGSFSRAASELKLSQPSASRIIADLEAELGVALFTRTTRVVSLTDAGGAYLEKVQAILDALDEANHAARGTGELTGNLRIAMGSTFAIRAVMPQLPAFLALHPTLRIDVVIEDRFQDLITDGIDLAFRFGDLSDSTAVSRRIATWPRVAVAAPAYLERRGTPAIPADLSDHDAIGMGSSGLSPWTFRRDASVTSVRVQPRFSTTTSEAALAACVQGLGIYRSQRQACDRELAAGLLVPILEDWDIGTVDLHAVYAAGRAAKPAARAFADHMAKHIAR